MRRRGGRPRYRILIFLLVAAALVGIAYFSLRSVIDGIQRRLYPCRYEELVCEVSEEFEIPQALLYAVIRTESRFDEDAVSAAGAKGLMQLMPKTYEWVMGKLGEEATEEGIFDPRINLRCGAYQLARLYRRFGDWTAALAAYNAGEGTVSGWLKDPTYAPEGKLETIPYRETSNYVTKVTEAARVYARLYGLPSFEDAVTTEEPLSSS